MEEPCTGAEHDLRVKSLNEQRAQHSKAAMPTSRDKFR